MFNVNQWINWQAIQVPGEVKPRKIPSNGHLITYDGSNIIGGINHLSSTNWIDYNKAFKRSELIGFVFTKNDPYFVIDIDHALKFNNVWSDVANTICAMFPGAYMEVSYSGDGLHIIAQGALAEGFKHKNQALGLEVYDCNRYMAITRTNEIGSTDIDHQAALNLFLSTYMKSSSNIIDLITWTNVPHIDWIGPEDDDELIDRMLASKPSANALWGGTATLQDLWSGNKLAFIDSYPDGKGGYDKSSPDMALALHLAFWTGKNCERIEQLMWRSGLARNKWKEHKTYLKNITIIKAVGMCQNVYKDPLQQAIISDALSNVGIQRQGYQFLTVDQQIEYFKGCVYVRDSHRVLLPDGALINIEQFKAVYGGYDFSIDNQNSKTWDCAWKIFSKSKSITFPKVTSGAFRPEIEAGLMFVEEGRTMVNTFQPVSVKRIKGDPRPFTDLIRRLFPDDNDRNIIMAYAAACVQHIGTKFQWTPLIQGVEGNGKSLIMKCISNAVGRRLSHFPNPNDISNKFNHWIEGKTFIGIEEIYIKNNFDAINTLKILITNDLIEIQPKNGNQYLGDNRANFFMCTNHRNAVKKTYNDRRYCNFFTPQQTYKDIINDGMGGRYFYNLIEWLKNDGYAIVAEYLATYNIPDELNPATLCNRAPVTTSTANAIEASMGSAEQVIMDAVDENLPGFRNGWISMMSLDALLIQTGHLRKISLNRRTEMLINLEYRKIGRSKINILQEKKGGRPILYLRNNIVVHEDFTSQYIHDQGYIAI